MTIKTKKAVIGTTLTWVISLLIIIFVLVIYFISINLLFEGRVISSSRIQLDSNFYGNFHESQNIISFINGNKGIIDEWADSDLIVSRGEFIEGIPEEKKALYDKLFNSYTFFIKNLGYEEPHFYIRTEKKEMQVSDYEFWSVKNPTNSEFFYSLEENKFERDPYYVKRYYFNSKGGNLVMIIFYDESKI